MEKTRKKGRRGVPQARTSRPRPKMIREEIEYMGPVRLREVETAQQHIIDVVRRLEEAGEIYVATGTEEDQMV